MAGTGNLGGKKAAPFVKGGGRSKSHPNDAKGRTRAKKAIAKARLKKAKGGADLSTVDLSWAKWDAEHPWSGHGKKKPASYKDSKSRTLRLRATTAPNEGIVHSTMAKQSFLSSMVKDADITSQRRAGSRERARWALANPAKAALHQEDHIKRMALEKGLSNEQRDAMLDRVWSGVDEAEDRLKKKRKADLRGRVALADVGGHL